MPKELPDETVYGSPAKAQEVDDSLEGRIAKLEQSLKYARQDAENAWKMFRAFRRRAEQAESIIGAIEAVIETVKHHDPD